MINLFGHDEYSLLGIAAILDVEKIPYRRVARPEDGTGMLLLATAGDLALQEVAAIRRRPALVMSGGLVFARQMFGAIDPSMQTRRCCMSLNESVWPRRVAACARSFGKTGVGLPPVPVCEVTRTAMGTTLAQLVMTGPDGYRRQPAIMRNGSCVWSVVDLGTAFADLLTEAYAPDPRAGRVPQQFNSMMRRMAEGAYYCAPRLVRTWVQRQCYARLEAQLATAPGDISEYPIDATGWLLIELVKSLIRLAAGWLVRLERWPAPFRAAATLTHDIEPTRYAYTRGLERLLAAPTGHDPALGLVAQASSRYLTETVVSRLRDHEIICHGIAHRGEVVHGRPHVEQRVQMARAQLERRLGRQLRGYRSPRLDRSPDLVWALDRNGFQYDSSYPDVDRENREHFGAGVRVNVPYRPLIRDVSGALHPSRCLELPLTAPDCIQPLLAGHSAARLRTDVAAKAAFVRETGGLYVALVHAGVFDDQDAAVRLEHLAFVCQELRRADTWLAGIGQIADWWCRRESLRLSIRNNEIHIANEGEHPVASLRVVVEEQRGRTVLPVPPLQPGVRATIAVAPLAATGCEPLRYPRCA
jgi:hypothetical protein